MRQFITAHENDLQQLATEARDCCLVFRDQEMPPGSRPARAAVAFEISGNPPVAMLLVDKGIDYTGSRPEIRQWMSEGVLTFQDFDSLSAWLRGPLRDAFEEETVAGGPGPGEGRTRTVGDLTDIEEVNRNLGDINRPLYLDEKSLSERLGESVFGQETALKSLSAAMIRHCARRRPEKPAVLFAVGPSGVGKTRSAEVLSRVIRDFNDGDNAYRFLRLDMTEYQESHRVSQLIGAPQGYIGHNEGSQLTDALSANPKTIVLFDEIEKAHPSILRVLQNAMDAGRLSTAARGPAGHEIDCRQAVFIFTSNLDAKEIIDELESRAAFGDRGVEDEVCRRRLHAAGIPADIIGRIGRFLVFRPLDRETQVKIVTLAITEIAAEYGLDIAHIEPSVVVELMAGSRSGEFGARPGRAMIDDALGGVFARTAAENTSGSLDLKGPPYECCRHDETPGKPARDTAVPNGPGDEDSRETDQPEE